MKDLRQLKTTAIATEEVWQDARERTLKHLRSDEALLDCAHCERVVVSPDALGHPPRQPWRGPCSPRVSQKVVRGRSFRRGEAYAS